MLTCRGSHGIFGHAKGHGIMSQEQNFQKNGHLSPRYDWVLMPSASSYTSRQFCGIWLFLKFFSTSAHKAVYMIPQYAGCCLQSSENSSWYLNTLWRTHQPNLRMLLSYSMCINRVILPYTVRDSISGTPFVQGLVSHLHRNPTYKLYGVWDCKFCFHQDCPIHMKVPLMYYPTYRALTV